MVNSSKSKINIKPVKIKVKNDCVLVTNLKINDKYTDDYILDSYKSRWDVEVFFKHIKYNFKFQNLEEKYSNQHKKMYYCELIIMYITKLIENEYMKTHTFSENTEIIEKINKSNLIKGVMDRLDKIISGSMNNDDYNNFIKAYIVINRNKNERSFPRTSKTPFTKWYIKGYSEMTKYWKIINAILNDTINELNKNLKTLAMRIKIDMKDG